MNILTFDIEEWFVWDNLGFLTLEKRAEYDRRLGLILDLLDSRGVKATFFCVGMMGERFPDVIKKIAERGHEIGCHSDVHSWLNKMTEKECREDTRSAIDRLEQCTGQKVISYRAPAFSVGEGSEWIFNVLCENGITRDSSVFPAKRDFGGFASFGADTPSVIRCGGSTLHEFPIPVTKTVFGFTAFSGGGYFRFFPYRFVSSRMKGRDYNICYFHLADFVKERKMTKSEYETYFKEKASGLSLLARSVKTNLGKGRSWSKFDRLLSSFDFVSLAQADSIVDWQGAPVALQQ